MSDGWRVLEGKKISHELAGYVQHHDSIIEAKERKEKY